jgi:DNA-directed RNA polymerase sigma subunit (sigma70/sigma32)
MKKIEFIEKEKRNLSLYRYHVANPGTSLESIGKIYHITKARVSQIILRIERKKEIK